MQESIVTTMHQNIYIFVRYCEFICISPLTSGLCIKAGSIDKADTAMAVCNGFYKRTLDSNFKCVKSSISRAADVQRIGKFYLDLFKASNVPSHDKRTQGIFNFP